MPSQAGGRQETLRSLIEADVRAATVNPLVAEARGLSFWVRVIAKCVLSPNIRVVVIYRLAHAFAVRGKLAPALLLRARGIRVSGAEINPLATIGPGLYLAHAVGVGIGAYVVIGEGCRIHLGAVIGPQQHGQDAPQQTVIGDGVYIGTHAVILGGVTIGNGATIGANAVVSRDVPEYGVVVAAPSRLVGQRQPDASRP